MEQERRILWASRGLAASGKGQPPYHPSPEDIVNALVWMLVLLALVLLIVILVKVSKHKKKAKSKKKKK